MHVHGLAEVAYDAFRAEAARLVFIRIASLAIEQLLIANCHTSATNPVVAVPPVYVIEIGQRESPR